ncbi:hypothetical protein OIDMADRAFT_53214 [Oidiodendron maius Zn]|uniref:AA1-like domain-containing protein n=1 Tax=Oidiodendron maius (strain Zn) TaxID=913774 RepID=A0A0C3CRS0_OIDMZ|nr:hypothetical protein OIDMADRAFT_53214 [Oidiodendron maius Zn]
MRFVKLLGLCVGVASTALNPLARLNLKRPSTLLPDVSPEPLRTSNKPVQPFSISNLYAQSFVDSSTTWNLVFADPNSNTSTVCSKSWIDSHNASAAPTTYVLCDDTGNEEDFQWQFTSYTNIQHFTIEFSHGWDDLNDFPPPYSWVDMFSTQNSFNLTCSTNAAGLQHCSALQNPYRAVVNEMAN